MPPIQGKEQRLCFAGAAVKRYPTPKVRETQVICRPQCIPRTFPKPMLLIAWCFITGDFKASDEHGKQKFVFRTREEFFVTSQHKLQDSLNPTPHIRNRPPATSDLTPALGPSDPHEPILAPGPSGFHSQWSCDPALPTSDQQPPHEAEPGNQLEQGPTKSTRPPTQSAHRNRRTHTVLTGETRGAKSCGDKRKAHCWDAWDGSYNRPGFQGRET
ncbi:hypothetical protein MG293_001480 [Ovis ammon polii]|uniref:Uncharacterized protein n=1 Tax=Ovis ammon polii TaxID=230172 RepID=A0AAD4URB2_OVIAM|nr:hypothetical protein MG293_001480 [Ovis ammon polii]